METILVWTLVIAAIAILLMLILLIASERELKRKSAELEALRSRHQVGGAGASVDSVDVGQPADENQARDTEIAALNQRLQSTIDTLETEIERLRAENTGLRRTSKEARGQRTPPVQEAASPQFAGFTLRAAGRRSKREKRRWRNILALCATSVLLLAGVSVYLNSDWRETEISEMGKGHVPAESQSTATLASTEILKSSETTKSKGAANMDAGEEPLPAPRVTDSPPLTTANPGKAKIATSKPSAPFNASYEIIAPTRVFSEPDEGSRAVARVEAGTEINVVGERGEWLEVRSRHGRPPGFVRKSAAVKRERN